MGKSTIGHAATSVIVSTSSDGSPLVKSMTKRLHIMGTSIDGITTGYALYTLFLCSVDTTTEGHSLFLVI